MSNTPRRRPVAQPKVVSDPPDVELWDAYVNDAAPDVEPWRKQLPDGTLLEVGCPTSEAIDKLGEAQAVGDVVSMMEAVFGEDAALVIDLTAKQPFTLRVRLINDVMLHYGMSASRLPESLASSS